jgi:hypothetical protein
MVKENINLKKIAAWFLAGVAALLLLSWLHSYFTNGTITVTTNDSSASVGIKQLTEPKKDSTPYFKTAPHTLSARLKVGKYQVFTFSGNFSTSKFIELKPHQKLNFNLTAPKASVPEPVYGNGAAGLITDGSQMFFIDPTTHYLSRIDPQNNLTVIDKTRPLTNAQWVNISMGVAEGQDHKLYLVQNNILSAVNLPFSTSADTPMSYSLTKAGKLYISNGKDIYSGTANGSFKKIYSSKGSGATIASAVDNKVAVIESEEERQDKTSLIVVDENGKVSKKDIEAQQARWSPDGKYLLTNEDDGNVTLLNESLKKVTDTVIDNADHFEWSSSTSFLYGINNQLWNYDINTNQAQNIATMPSATEGDGTIGAVFPTDTSYIYVTSQKVSIDSENATYQLFRVGLNGQQVASNIQSVSIFLPETVGVCSLNYLNFKAPSIVVQYPTSSIAPACIDTAKQELQSYELNPGDFQIKAIPKI